MRILVKMNLIRDVSISDGKVDMQLSSTSLAPITEKLAEAYAGKIKFCKINVDENPVMSGRYKVMSIPLVLFFNAGVQKDSSLGAVPEAVLRSKLQPLL
jgi:thioredoxin 1